MTLLVAFGNTLRREDGVAHRVLELLAIAQRMGSGLITIEKVTVLQYGHRAAGAPVA